jgi:F0F1-type ATP synthase membrane subunit b/b'
MREAKTEAESIIAAYRAEMEANYQKNLAQVHIYHVHIHGSTDSIT